MNLESTSATRQGSNDDNGSDCDGVFNEAMPSTIKNLFGLHIGDDGKCVLVDDITGSVDTSAIEKLNGFLERYVEEVKEAKLGLERQLRWFERKGAFRLLGFDDAEDLSDFQNTLDGSDGNSDDTDSGVRAVGSTQVMITEAAVRKRYHRLSLRCHPDKGGDSMVFQKLKKAYESVRKELRRRKKLQLEKRGQCKQPQKRHEVELPIYSSFANTACGSTYDTLQRSDARGKDEPSSHLSDADAFDIEHQEDSGDDSLSGEVNSEADSRSSPFSSPEPKVNSNESSDEGSTHSGVRAASSIDTPGDHRPLESEVSFRYGETVVEHEKKAADDGGGNCRRHSTSSFHAPRQPPVRSSRLILAMVAKARVAAEKAATLAHICMQWGKVVDEVRLLSRPRGVDHMSSLINKGAFNSVLAVMEPTEEAALTVLDIVSSCVEVTKEDKSMAIVAGRMGFFPMAEKVTAEGRTALAAAAAAANVNATAIKAMGRLGTLGTVARDDDEVHSALVDMLCLQFSRVAECTQHCAKQSIVAVTAGSKLCAFLDVMSDAAQSDAEYGLSDEEHEEDEDEVNYDSKNERPPRDAAEAEGQRSGACSDEQIRTEGKRGEDNALQPGLHDVDAIDHIDDDHHPNGTDEETKDTVGSLLGKLRDLHIAMRQRHCQTLQRINAEVLDLQRKVAECARDTDPASLHFPALSVTEAATRAGEATAVVHFGNGQLLNTLADLGNGTCVAIDVACRTRISSAPHHASNCTWWVDQLQRETEWLTTLACQDRVAIAASTRGRVLRLAALLEPDGVRQLLSEMVKRLQRTLMTCGLLTDETCAAVETRFRPLLAAVRRIGCIPTHSMCMHDDGV